LLGVSGTKCFEDKLLEDLPEVVGVVKRENLAVFGTEDVLDYGGLGALLKFQAELGSVRRCAGACNQTFTQFELLMSTWGLDISSVQHPETSDV
jgi:hypothetical protein